MSFSRNFSRRIRKCHLQVKRKSGFKDTCKIVHNGPFLADLVTISKKACHITLSEGQKFIPMNYCNKVLGISSNNMALMQLDHFLITYFEPFLPINTGDTGILQPFVRKIEKLSPNVEFTSSPMRFGH